MGKLLPQVLDGLTTSTGARFELVVLENSLFGPTVTTAGLLPGAAIEKALRGRREFDLALFPAEAVSDDLVFVDDVKVQALARRLPMPVRLSYDFADALTLLSPSRNRGSRSPDAVVAVRTERPGVRASPGDES
jgi:hypothetical protein